MRVRLKQFTKLPNAGDAASSFLVGKALNSTILTSDNKPLRTPNLVGLGSILHWADRNSYIWGSGLISESICIRVPPKAILAVRGYLTQRKLRDIGLVVPGIVGDPGILISDFFEKPEVIPGQVGLVVHYADKEVMGGGFSNDVQEAGMIVIDPLQPLPLFLHQLASCEVIASSSLHGIIFAHSFGTPAAWVELSSSVHGGGFKFFDYYSSVGIACAKVERLSRSATVSQIIRAARLPEVEIDRKSLLLTLLQVRDKLLMR